MSGSKKVIQHCAIGVLAWLPLGIAQVAQPSIALAQSLPNPSLPSPPLVATSAETPADYLLGAGDTISLTVFGYDEYTGPLTILPDGTISLPLVGSVEAAGRTSDQLASELQSRLQSLLVDPAVSIQVLTPRPVVVNVAGEVMRPGPLQLTDTTTLSAALIAAGGITQNADIRSVEVRRNQGNGESVVTTLNLWDAINSDNPPPDLVLQAGDAIYVPTALGDTGVDNHLVSRSSFAPTSVRVRVVGEVTAPGEVEVPPGSSLSSAVAIAGGPTDDAKLSEVAFIRMTPDGRIERQVVDLRDLTDGFQVQDGDVVIVPEQESSSFLDFAGRLLSPLSLLFGLF